MPRPELFFLLACAFAVAIMSGTPLLPMRVPPVTIASLYPADEAGASRIGLHASHHDPQR